MTAPAHPVCHVRTLGGCCLSPSHTSSIYLFTKREQTSLFTLVSAACHLYRIVPRRAAARHVRRQVHS